jgi:hypothetical protein
LSLLATRGFLAFEFGDVGEAEGRALDGDVLSFATLAAASEGDDVERDRIDWEVSL